MSFTFTGAFIGPYCASIGRGKPGDIQRFRFSARDNDSSHMPYAQIVMEGGMEVTWSTDIFPPKDFVAGGSFYYDQLGAWLKGGEEMTAKALNSSSYLCVVATGTEQQVLLERHQLAPGETIIAERFSLVAIAGADSAIRVDGGEVSRGVRLIYAKSKELKIEAAAASNVAVFSLLA